MEQQPEIIFEFIDALGEELGVWTSLRSGFMEEIRGQQLADTVIMSVESSAEQQQQDIPLGDSFWSPEISGFLVELRQEVHQELPPCYNSEVTLLTPAGAAIQEGGENFLSEVPEEGVQYADLLPVNNASMVVDGIVLPWSIDRVPSMEVDNEESTKDSYKFLVRRLLADDESDKDKDDSGDDDIDDFFEDEPRQPLATSTPNASMIVQEDEVEMEMEVIS